MKILLAAALILLSGCQTLLSSPIGTPSTTRLPIERLPLGTPHVQLTPNATKDRWTIHVTQQFDDVKEVHTVQQQAARRYLFWPLAPLNGLIQCPAGLIASAISSREGANHADSTAGQDRMYSASSLLLILSPSSHVASSCCP